MIENLEAEGLIRPLAIDPTRVEGALSTPTGTSGLPATFSHRAVIGRLP